MRFIWHFLLSSLLCVLFFIHSGFQFPQTEEYEFERMNMMDPETLYSFTRADGSSFLTRKPLEIPPPAFVGQKVGLISFRIGILPSGSVNSVQLDRSTVTRLNADMLKSAREAVKQWKFSPLNPQMPQVEEFMRVLIQFNFAGSGVLFSMDGRCMVSGLGDRKPIRLLRPVNRSTKHGYVSVDLRVDPDGSIAWIDDYEGKIPGEEVVPFLGIITDKAVRQWTFRPLVEGSYIPGTPEAFQLIKVKFKY
ncbi:hypothetical protein [Pontibacter sp. G13]|uniref:hypothetical protein n=1 Tax=Pontibacter sp. G13 TaxID=3074898 RepID=UPI00288C4472|nr:hypothetical protein [Pontibacter sp. G13]WNJ16694.1 hypothetical protein RJD25_17650 [Pontibacter sp. G13]